MNSNSTAVSLRSSQRVLASLLQHVVPEHLVDVFRNGVCLLCLGQTSLYVLHPLGGEVLERKHVRAKADPVLIRQYLETGKRGNALDDTRGAPNDRK